MSRGKLFAWCAGLFIMAVAIAIVACSEVSAPQASNDARAERGAANWAESPSRTTPPASSQVVTALPGQTAGQGEGNQSKADEIWIVPTDPQLAGGTPSQPGTQQPGQARGGRGAGRGGAGGARGRGAGGGGRASGGRAGGPGIASGPTASPSATPGNARGGQDAPLTLSLSADADVVPNAVNTQVSLPTSPILAARQADGQLVPVPLKHTDVSATISGYIASVGVTQQFTNPYSEKIEAVYVFPLPENAGISEFVMTIGDRHIRGIIRERAEAEKIYAEARAQGYVASLMTQERPNIFTQNVANIEPGKQIDIEIKYFHTLAYQDGYFEWVFPMVVGPRYNPANSGADAPVGNSGTGIGAVAQGARGASGQKTEIQYLRPEQRSGHDIALKVQLDAGVAIEGLTSINHKIHQAAQKNNRTLVELDPADSIPNKDFVLRYKVAGDHVKSGLFVQKNKDGNGGYFTLMVVPPEDLKSLPRRGVEMVFVVDTSGSMSGQPIAQAKAAVTTALSMMNPADTFQIVKFDNTAGQMAPAPLPVNNENIAQARQFVATLAGGGGTEMIKGMNAALAFPHDENRTRVVAFLTDGFIGNELQVLRGLHDQLLDSRVFSFGVGPSTNRYLLDSMARLGHGSAAYLSLNEPAEPVMNAYFERISHPALANVKVDFGGIKVSDVYPQRIPELFVGRPIYITGRYTGSIPSNADITVSGRVGDGSDRPLRFSLPANSAIEENPAIATIWARTKITDLADESIYEGRDVTKDIKETALTYGLMSEVTSFVAVDSSQKTTGDHGTTVAVPVPVPEGVRYETTVQERQ